MIALKKITKTLYQIYQLASKDFIDKTFKIKYSDLSVIDYIYKNLDVYMRKDTVNILR